MRFRITFWDVLVGFPAGLLIFMGTVLFNTLVGQLLTVPNWLGFLLLIAVAFGVGILAGISRLRQGPATGLAAGIITAMLLGYLVINALPTDSFNPLVIGLPGILAVIIISPLGGLYGARLRKAL